MRSVLVVLFGLICCPMAQVAPRRWRERAAITAEVAGPQVVGEDEDHVRPVRSLRADGKEYEDDQGNNSVHGAAPERARVHYASVRAGRQGVMHADAAVFNQWRGFDRVGKMATT